MPIKRTDFPFGKHASLVAIGSASANVVQFLEQRVALGIGVVLLFWQFVPNSSLAHEKPTPRVANEPIDAFMVG